MKILEQLILNGVAQKDFDLLESKLKFTIKSLSGKEQLSIEKWMQDVSGTPVFVVHNFTLRMLAYGLVSYQDNKFIDKSPEEKLKFVEELDTTIIDLITESQKDFYEQCKKSLNPDELELLLKTPSPS
jgi:endonuclease III-like uncharacterized protein